MNQDTRRIVGVVAQTLLADMRSTSRLHAQLAESVGFDNGYQQGFRDGVHAAQANMQTAMLGVQEAAGYPREESA